MESTHLKNTRDGLVQFSMALADEKGPQRLIGFSRPELFNKLKAKKSQCHMDATFDCCPRGFYQCLIIAIYDEELNIFQPCFWVLMTRKTERMYVFALEMIKAIVGKQWDPQWFLVDFELGMVNSIRKVFPGCTPVGCFFHFKQAATRKMMECGMPKDMSFNVANWLDLMTVIPKDEVFTKFIPYFEYNILEVYGEQLGTQFIGPFNNFVSYLKSHWDNPKILDLISYSDKKMEL